MGRIVRNEHFSKGMSDHIRCDYCGEPSNETAGEVKDSKIDYQTRDGYLDESRDHTLHEGCVKEMQEFVNHPYEIDDRYGNLRDDAFEDAYSRYYHR